MAEEDGLHKREYRLLWGFVGGKGNTKKWDTEQIWHIRAALWIVIRTFARQNQSDRAMNKDWTEDIKKACRVMEEGGVILYPTDTIWGLGCDATNEEAVRRIYEIKRRADSKAMLVLVDSAVKVDYYVQDVPSVAWDLLEVADKPLTVIYSGARNLAPNLLAEDGSVGIRVTSEEFSKALCFRFRKAIVSTSANVSGQPSPRTFAEISEEIKQAVDYIVEARRTETAPARPSSIIKLGSGGEVKIIRQ